MITVEGVENEVSIPETADEWELFTDMKGVGRAARSLTGALKKALKARTRDQAIKIMCERMTKYSEFGAYDTEPRDTAERCLTEGRGGNYTWSL